MLVKKQLSWSLMPFCYLVMMHQTDFEKKKELLKINVYAKKNFSQHILKILTKLKKF